MEIDEGALQNLLTFIARKGSVGLAARPRVALTDHLSPLGPPAGRGTGTAFGSLDRSVCNYGN